jgi:hypothetical protein
MSESWFLCSACRTGIAFGSKYYQCSVSTCNRARMRLVFCSVVCWDSHVATLRHRDAWAEDKIAPTKLAWERELASQPLEPARQSLGAPRPAAPAPAIARPAATGGPASTSSIARPAPAGGPVSAPSFARPAPAGGPVSAPSFARPAPTAPMSAPSFARRVVGEPAPASPATTGGVHLHDNVDRDLLIVMSKLKKYIKDRSGMNCADAVAEVLSDHVRALCDDSIRAAGREERKTVLDRDVPRPRR